MKTFMLFVVKMRYRNKRLEDDPVAFIFEVPMSWMRFVVIGQCKRIDEITVKV